MHGVWMSRGIMCWAIVRRLTVLEVRAGCQTLGRGEDDHFLIINEFIINI